MIILWSAPERKSFPCGINTVRSPADCTVAPTAPQGEYFLTWAATSFIRSSQKFPEETRTVVSNVWSEDPLEVPDKVQRFHRNTHCKYNCLDSCSLFLFYFYTNNYFNYSNYIKYSTNNISTFITQVQCKWSNLMQFFCFYVESMWIN